MTNEQFKLRLRQAYQRVGGQEAVERNTGIAQATLSYWAGAARKLPPSDKLASLAAACGVTVEWLLTGVAPRPPIDRDLLTTVLEEIDHFLTRPRRGRRMRRMIPADKAALAARIYALLVQRDTEDRAEPSNVDLRARIVNLLLQE